MSKIILKSSCKDVSADGVVCTQKSARDANVLVTEEVQEKNCNENCKNFQKKMNNFKKLVVTPTVYVMRRNWQTFNT